MFVETRQWILVSSVNWAPVRMSLNQKYDIRFTCTVEALEATANSATAKNKQRVLHSLRGESFFWGKFTFDGAPPSTRKAAATWYTILRTVQCYTTISVGRDSSVGIATRHGLDGPGIESRWRRDFAHPSRPTLGPTQPPKQWVPGLARG